ncbi:MAG: M20/M25/M40 family metallo-hydrolase [Clostridia bacterium]|nr:M20/M25/M40 family metallo-hydrolase [Clostridia bacterium]
MDLSGMVADYEKQISELTELCWAEIHRLCSAYGGRDCGGESEKSAQLDLAGKLAAYCPEVRREEFSVSPEAFMSFVPVAGSMLIGATALNAVSAFKKNKLASAAAGVLTGAALGTVVGEFALYRQLLDPLFRKKTSGNVVGVRPSSGETRRRIILSGHTDSAPEWTYTYKLGSHGVIIVAAYAVGGLVYTAASSVLTALLKNRRAARVLAAGQAIFLPAYGLLFRFVDFDFYVPGASDDLSGVETVMSVMKFLSDNDVTFEHTEVVALLTGGEEAGLRGSKAFFRAHPELKNDGVETVFLGFDTLRDAEYMAIYKGDMSGVVKNDLNACALLARAAEKEGFAVPITSIPLGATDAAAASQAGVPASAFVAMDPAPARYYHTRLDTADNIVPETIGHGIKIALNALCDFDANGLGA